MPGRSGAYFEVADSSLHPLRISVARQYVFTQPGSFRQRRIDSQATCAEEPEGTSAVSTHWPEYDGFVKTQVATGGGGGASCEAAVTQAETGRSANPMSPRTRRRTGGSYANQRLSA
jgi:hypothetical protein